MKNIAAYEDILNNYDSMAAVIMGELDQIKKEYGSKRKTSIENAEEAVYEEKKMEETEVCFLMDRFGYMRLTRMPTSVIKMPLMQRAAMSLPA